jgi:hypothetical protein
MLDSVIYPAATAAWVIPESMSIVFRVIWFSYAQIMRARFIRLSKENAGPESKMKKCYADDRNERNKCTPGQFAFSRDGCPHSGVDWHHDQQQVEEPE